jgi:hypothetical protein
LLESDGKKITELTNITKLILLDAAQFDNYL